MVRFEPKATPNVGPKRPSTKLFVMHSCLMTKLSNEELLVIATASIVLVVGMAINVLVGECSTAFQRAGSVVVCIGIFFSFLDVGGIYEGKFEDELEKLRAKKSENDMVFSEEELEIEVRGSTNFLIKRAKLVRDKNKTRVALVDLGILLLGTFIWGFGDLVV